MVFCHIWPNCPCFLGKLALSQAILMPLWAPWAVLSENQQLSKWLNMIGVCLIYCNHSCTLLILSFSWWHNTFISLLVMNALDVIVGQIHFLCVWVVPSWVSHKLLCQEFNKRDQYDRCLVIDDLLCLFVSYGCMIEIISMPMNVQWASLPEWVSNELLYQNSHYGVVPDEPLASCVVAHF